MIADRSLYFAQKQIYIECIEDLLIHFTLNCDNIR